QRRLPVRSKFRLRLGHQMAEAPGPLPTVSASARRGSPTPLGPSPSPDSQGLAGQCLRTGIHHGPERRATAPVATRRSLLRAGTGGSSKLRRRSSRPALHHDWRPGVVGEDEGRRVIRGIVAPPALPRVVRPFAADRAEHIAAEDEGAEAFRRGAGEAIVSPAVFPDHRSKGPGRVEPTVQLLAPFAERMLQALVRAGPEAVDGHSKSRYAHLAH